jgi:predicted GNAT family acetyltransferase
MVRREPMMTCTREQLLPVDVPDGLSYETLTQASPLDAVRLELEVNEHGFDPTFAGSVTIDQAERFRSTLAHARAFIARQDSEPAAAGMFHPPIDGLTQFSGIATLAPFRRRGIAAALTSFMAQAAFDAGADLVYLAAANEPARRVYHRLGFREVGTLLVYA